VLARAGGEAAGEVTSAAWSPLAGRVLALARLRAPFFGPGTELEVFGRPATLVDHVAADTEERQS
jgi:glycine cleavage system aminomethyltransferase T